METDINEETVRTTKFIMDFIKITSLYFIVSRG